LFSNEHNVVSELLVGQPEFGRKISFRQNLQKTPNIAPDLASNLFGWDK
jgi:hypothetical protein